MAQKDADLASDYSERSLYLSEVAVAAFEVEVINVTQPSELAFLYLNEGVTEATFEILEAIGASTGPAVDITPPVITNVDPPTGTRLDSRAAPITFDVTDVDPGVKVVIVTVKYAHRPETQVVYNGSDFITPFNSAGSQVTAITDGFRFQVTPENQWLGDIDNFFVYAIDNVGNVEGLP